MHRISKIKIENFRSCESMEVDLQLFTPIVGPNNVGKSNIIRALEWAIKPSTIQGEAFCRDAPGQPVQVTLTIEGITDDILLTLDPKHAKATEPFIDNGTLVIRRSQNEPGLSVKQISLEVLDPADGTFGSAPTGIPQGMQSLFPEAIHVEAMIDAAADAAKNTASSTIGKLLKLVTQDIQKTYSVRISQAMQPFKDLLSANGPSRAKELTTLDDDTNKALAELFPGLEARVHVPEPTLDVAFKSATVQVQESGSKGTWQDFSLLGHGAQRSVQMALIQALASRKNPGGDGQCILLLIDEPELYLHPQAIEQVREALLNLSLNGFQVVFSTHSPQMIQSEDIPHTLIIRKNGSSSSCRTMAQTVQTIQGHQAQSEILFSLSGNSQILFCDNVLLAEGKTEHQLLPILYKQHHGTSMGADRLGFIPLGGCGDIVGAMNILKAMDIPTKTLTDLDFVCVTGHKKGLCPYNQKDIQLCLHYVKQEKDRGINQAAAYAQCIKHPACTAAVNNICNSTINHNVWVWRYGDIESVLGLPDKENSTRMQFRDTVQANGIDACVTYPDELKNFLDWVRPL